MFHRLRLDMNVIGSNAQCVGDFRLHYRKVWQQFGLLCQDVRIDITDLVSLLADEISGISQELQTRYAFEAVIRIRKHFTDIAEPTGAEQGIRNGMTEHISVGMSAQSVRMRQSDATDFEGNAWFEFVRIPAVAYANFRGQVSDFQSGL